jgi:hypothetical protein
MMEKTRWLNLLIRTLVLFLVLGTAACGQAAEIRPHVWIDAPGDGALVPAGSTVTVMSHAYAREGVAEVVLTIDGAAYRRDAPVSSGADYVQISQDWQPPADGTYAVQVQAYDASGQVSNTAAITVRVGGGTITATPAPVITDTPVITETFIPTETPTNTPTSPPPGAAIQFWADPPQIQAGACTTIRWHVENAAQVIFGGVAQPFDGSYKDCMCQGQRYQLTVIQLDASQETRTVDIAVNGACVTLTTPAPPPDDPEPPQPQKDTTPPPVPEPRQPPNGQVMSCGYTPGLLWLPVSDPSSPVKYYVKLEIKLTANEWRSVAGYGPTTGYSVTPDPKQIQCGGIYRWMVRAEDAAGNISNWSAPSNFSVNLE